MKVIKLNEDVDRKLYYDLFHKTQEVIYSEEAKKLEKEIKDALDAGNITQEQFTDLMSYLSRRYIKNPEGTEKSEQDKLRDIAEEFLTVIKENYDGTFELDKDKDGVYLDDDGNLVVWIYGDDLEVRVEAEWQTGIDDDLDDIDTDTIETVTDLTLNDVLSGLETLPTDIDNFKIIDVKFNGYDDIDYDFKDVDVESSCEEDSGIGWYEYWGEKGYDSHPYYQVSGTIGAIINAWFKFTINKKDED